MPRGILGEGSIMTITWNNTYGSGITSQTAAFQTTFNNVVVAVRLVDFRIAFGHPPKPHHGHCRRGGHQRRARGYGHAVGRAPIAANTGDVHTRLAHRL